LVVQDLRQPLQTVSIPSENLPARSARITPRFSAPMSRSSTSEGIRLI
jgi:hypothetical protein